MSAVAAAAWPWPPPPPGLLASSRPISALPATATASNPAATYPPPHGRRRHSRVAVAAWPLAASLAVTCPPARQPAAAAAASRLAALASRRPLRDDA